MNLLLLLAAMACALIAGLIDTGALTWTHYGAWLAASLFFLAAASLPFHRFDRR